MTSRGLNELVVAFRMHNAIRGVLPMRTRAQHFHRAAWVLFACAVLAAAGAVANSTWGPIGYWMWWVGSVAYVGAAGWSVWLFGRWVQRRAVARADRRAALRREPSFR